jgi:hypothetical protein
MKEICDIFNTANERPVPAGSVTFARKVGRKYNSFLIQFSKSPS